MQRESIASQRHILQAMGSGQSWIPAIEQLAQCQSPVPTRTMSEMRFISLTPDMVITNHSHLNPTQHVLIAVPDVLARAETVWCPSILPLYVKKRGSVPAPEGIGFLDPSRRLSLPLST